MRVKGGTAGFGSLSRLFCVREKLSCVIWLLRVTVCSMRIGELLKAWREKRSLTLREMAPQIGVSLPTLSRLERGMMPDGKTTLKVLAWVMAEL